MMHLRRKFRWLASILTLIATGAPAGETINGIGITMVDIPAGTFVMGACLPSASMPGRPRQRPESGPAILPSDCVATSDGYDTEAPPHQVTSRAFQMGKTEVTLRQFKRYIDDGGRKDLMTDNFMKFNAFGDDAPVVYVSWHDAQAFIHWLNKAFPGGYRLPSEAEWEYACRAAGDTKYCGGDKVSVLAWYGENTGNQKGVGRLKSNAFGLFDMSGNAWEWMQDCWHDSYAGAPNDGGAWGYACDRSGRVLRGGGWDGKVASMRATYRALNGADYLHQSYGFRVARSR